MSVGKPSCYTLSTSGISQEIQMQCLYRAKGGPVKVLGVNSGRLSEYRCRLLTSIPQQEVHLVISCRAGQGSICLHLISPHLQQVWGFCQGFLLCHCSSLLPLETSDWHILVQQFPSGKLFLPNPVPYIVVPLPFSQGQHKSSITFSTTLPTGLPFSSSLEIVRGSWAEQEVIAHSHPEACNVEHQVQGWFLPQGLCKVHYGPSTLFRAWFYKHILVTFLLLW